MKELDLTVSDIKELMNTFSKNKLGSFKIQQGQFSLELEGCKVEQVIASAAPAATVNAPASAPDVAQEPVISGNIVKSPIVGTFYAAPSPDKAPYISVGSRVQKGDVLFIIESMKLMNEVTSEFDGTVARILVENAQTVEFGQPILTIE